MKATILVVPLAAISITVALAGSARAATNDFDVTVESVTDTRSTGNMMPRCIVQLRISGDEVADALEVHDIRITSAMDDSGHDLRLEQDRNRMQHRYPMMQPNMAQLSHPVELAGPSRSAHAIKTLEGEVELLFPTPDNGGMIIIKDFMKHSGEQINDPMLKKSDVRITFLGRDSGDGNQYGGVVPLSANGVSHAARVRAMGRRLQFSVDDPDHRLVDLAFIDAYGRQVQAWNQGGPMDSTTRTYMFQSEPPSNLQLYIYLAAPDAIKMIPFKIENIELP